MNKTTHTSAACETPAQNRRHTESNVLTFIKYGPAAFILAVCALFAAMSYYELRDMVAREVSQTTRDYVASSRDLVKNQVEHAVKQLELDYRSLETELRTLSRQDVNFAISLIQSVEQEEPEATSKSATDEVLEALRRARLRTENGYFIVFTMDAQGVLNQNYPNYPGLDLTQVKDRYGRYIVADVVAHLRDHEDMEVDWYWHQPNHPSDIGRKIGYCRKYALRNWVVCTGSYIDEYSQQAMERSLRRLERMRYAETGYVYAIDYQDIVRAHIRPGLVGKNLFDLNSYKPFLDKWREARDIAKAGGGYITVPSVPKANGEMSSTKVQYVQAFPAWQLIIGSGYYEDDVEKVLVPRIAFLNERYNNYIRTLWLIGGSIALVALAVSLLLSHRIERLFTSHKDELEKLSNSDKLTGLNNRLKLDTVLEYEFRKFQRYGEPLSLILVDVDRFKQVNDTYGHQVGDQVLIGVAQILDQCRRETDVVGRWGGEEFLIVCPHTTSRDAKTVAERYRNTIAEHDFGEVRMLTASFGVTQISPHDAIANAVKRADDALYAAKAHGRNRVVRLD